MSPELIEAIRHQCYPLVPLAELKPALPEPSEELVTTAMRALASAISESRFASGRLIHLPEHPSDRSIANPAWLAYAYESGFTREAAEWAVYRHVEAGRLTVVWPDIERQCQRADLEKWATRLRGDRPETARDWDLFEGGRILHLRSTPQLWVWRKDTKNTARTEGGSGRASPPPMAAKKGKHIDARMLKLLSENPIEALDWESPDWAAKLDCGDSTVRKSKTWKKHLPSLRAEMVVSGNRVRGGRKLRNGKSM